MTTNTDSFRQNSFQMSLNSTRPETQGAKMVDFELSKLKISDSLGENVGRIEYDKVPDRAESEDKKKLRYSTSDIEKSCVSEKEPLLNESERGKTLAFHKSDIITSKLSEVNIIFIHYYVLYYSGKPYHHILLIN